MRYLLTLLLCLVPLGAAGQNFGNIKPNTVIGNPDPSASKPAVPRASSFTSPMDFGAVGDGVADDTVPLQTAINASASTGVTVHLGNHKYLISAALTATLPVSIVGAKTDGDAYASACNSGIVVNSNINALVLTAKTGSVKGVCFQMASSPGTRASGAAIVISHPAGSNAGHYIIEDNTVINPYDGIILGATGSGGTYQLLDTQLIHNLIINPSHIGIQNGPGSTGGQTNGTAMHRNHVQCSPPSNASAIGIAVYDGAVDYNGADTGTYLCNIGIYIAPGAVGGAGQLTLGKYTGVVGDSSISNDLVMDVTSNLGIAYYFRFVGAWMGSVTATDNSVLIKNTGNGTMTNVNFVGSVFHGGASQSVPIIDIQKGTYITIEGSVVDSFAGPQIGPGIKLGAGAQYISILNNIFTASGGATWPGTGIQIMSGANVINIQGNTITAPTTGISYVPNGETATIKNNMGLDNLCPSVASAASISIPNAASCVNLSGSVSIADITNSWWSGRSLVLRSASGLSLLTSGAGGTKFCAAKTMVAGQMTTLTYDISSGCWATLQ